VALSVGITDPIRAIDKGAPLALIRVIGNSAPYVLIGKPNLKSITHPRAKSFSVGADNDITTVYFERMMAANGFQEGDTTPFQRGSRAARFAALKPASSMRRSSCHRSTSRPRPRLRHACLAADYVKDVPFTGMAVHRRWPPQHFGRETDSRRDRQKHRLARRPVAPRPKRSSSWSRSPVRSKDDADASYDFLHRIDYFEPTSKVSRTKLPHLVAMEQRAGTVDPAFRHRPASPCRVSPNSRIERGHMKLPRREFLRLGAAAVATPRSPNGLCASVADARGAYHRWLPARWRRRRGRPHRRRAAVGDLGSAGHRREQGGAGATSPTTPPPMPPPTAIRSRSARRRCRFMPLLYIVAEVTIRS